MLAHTETNTSEWRLASDFDGHPDVPIGEPNECVPQLVRERQHRSDHEGGKE
jgi:hypothetical protein